MPQRIHKKSRNGCLECKRRHVKCDERQPICSNCAAAERACGYGSRSLRTVPPVLPRARAHSALRSSILSSASPESPAGDSSPTPSTKQPVNLLHIELFHNLYTKIRPTFDPNRSIPWLGDDMDFSMMTPYLMNELLAFSALHLSTKCPNQRAYFRYHAAELQTNALSLFKASSANVTKENCVPIFVFAAALGIHMLADTLIYREGDLPDFLDRYVHFFRVYHGVRTIVGKAADVIPDTPLGPAFEMGKELYRFTGSLGPTCESLLDMIYTAKLGKDVTAIYKQAIESLQSCLNVIEKWNSERHVGINAVTTWPILMDIQFGEFLAQRRPEALVILAHYACLLHRFRHFWLFGDSGAWIIGQVGGYLGGEWEGWMGWPNEVLGS
ncbi:hypothetical protein BDW74DRAFT_187937 [Aspergillus multicolor]|uniref:Zn(II)2Cys6 transcription factor domain-containing protein n=1 Tax=Aspergillus multicolor TaxID=41759 RepID=UPI003CCDA98B